METSAGAFLFKRLDEALPQTQCTRCGFADCAAYAHAIAEGQAGIDRCPPGGAEGVERLARITGLPRQPLNPSHGCEAPRAVAVIDEAWCIGCTLCLKACPVDAIIGGNKAMHTVMEAYCTGCELCLPVCPVDCIGLEQVTGVRTGWSAWSAEQADTARIRYAFHSKRNSHENSGCAEKPAVIDQSGANPDGVDPCSAPSSETQDGAVNRKRSVIEAALARERAQRPAGRSS